MPGPATEPGFPRARPAPDGMQPGARLAPTLSGATGLASIAGAGPVPGAGEGDGRGAWSGGHGLLRDRIQSRIVYPEDAVRRGIEGEVLLRIRIETGGNPGEIRVARSSGARLLDEAARRGVVRAAPLPASPGWVEVPVLFRLR